MQKDRNFKRQTNYNTALLETLYDSSLLSASLFKFRFFIKKKERKKKEKYWW
jgi:hypothetical protein